MKIVNKIITTLLSLCLMLLMMAICLLSSVPAFFSPSTYLSALEEANAYKSIQESIQNSLDDIMLFNNMDRQAMREFMTVEEVKEVVVGDVYALLSWLNGTGKNVAPLDVSIYEARFDERINTFFLENQYYLDDDAKQDVELMKKNGKIVLLTASPETIYDRVKYSNERPLLNGNMSVEYIKDLMEKRKDRYESIADIIIDTDNKPIHVIAEEVVSKLATL